MTNSNDAPNVAANTTLVAATPTTQPMVPEAVLSPWDNEVVDLLEQVARNTEGLGEDHTAQATGPTAQQPASVNASSDTTIASVSESSPLIVAAQLSAPNDTTTQQENQPQLAVVTERVSEEDQQHNLARLQESDSTVVPTETTPLTVHTAPTSPGLTGPTRLANGQFAPQATTANTTNSQFDRLVKNMKSDNGDLAGYALGGGLWSVAKESMGLMQHAKGLFANSTSSANTSNTNNTNSTRNSPNSSNNRHSTHRNTTQGATANNTASGDTLSNTTGDVHVSPSAPPEHRATNDQHPNQPDVAVAAPESTPHGETTSPSAGQLQHAQVREHTQTVQQQASESAQLERQTQAIVTEERNTQQLLKGIQTSLSQQTDCCCCEESEAPEIDLDKKKKNNNKDNNRRGNKWLNKAGKFAKFGGPLAGVITAATTYQALKDRDDLTTTQKTVQIGATTTGAMGGTTAGVMAGASIGSVVPVIGTVIGGLIGGLVGGAAGSWFGEIAGEAASDYLADNTSTSVVEATHQPAQSAAANRVKANHSELHFNEPDHVEVNTTTTRPVHQSTLSHTQPVQPTAITPHYQPVDPVPIHSNDTGQSTNTTGVDKSTTVASTSPAHTVTLDEQKLGQAFAKSLQQYPQPNGKPVTNDPSTPTALSSIPTEFDDVVLTLMSHDRI